MNLVGSTCASAAHGCMVTSRGVATATCVPTDRTLSQMPHYAESNFVYQAIYSSFTTCGGSTLSYYNAWKVDVCLSATMVGQSQPVVMSCVVDNVRSTDCSLANPSTKLGGCSNATGVTINGNIPKQWWGGCGQL